MRVATEKDLLDGVVPRTDARVRHLFFDCGAGASMAFFEVRNVGEREDYATDVSASVELGE